MLISDPFTSVREPNTLIDQSCYTYHISNIFILFLKKSGWHWLTGNPWKSRTDRPKRI